MTRYAVEFGGTTFVLAGGGSHGAVQVGMLQALTAAGVQADAVVGTSVGAINGAFYAADPTVGGVARMAAIWQGLAADGLYPSLPLAFFRALIRREAHLVNPSRLRNLLMAQLPAREFRAMVLPLAVIAADLRDGSVVVLREGNAIDAVLASAAVPGLFPPVQLGGRTLVDGALAKNAALSSAVTLGAARLIVLPTGFGCASPIEAQSVVGQAVRIISILLARQLAYEAEQFADRLPVHVVPPLCPLNVSSYDFSHSMRLIDAARDSTAQWIAEGGLESSVVPATLAPHHH